MYLFIGDKDLAEYAVLEEGVTVFLVPQPKHAADREPWRETIGMFKDDPAFEEMMEAVWAEREAGRKSGNLDCLDRFSTRCHRADGEQE